MKFGICNEIFKGWTLDRTFEFVAATGYDCLEIAPFTLAPYVTEISAEQKKMVSALAARHALSVSGIHWVLAQTDGLHLTHPDQGVRARTSDYLVALVEFCSEIGGKSMVVGSPKQRNRLEDVGEKEAWGWAAETFQRGVDRAEDLGVTICLEPLSPAETNFINTAEEAIRFIDQFQSEALRIILDVKAMSSEKKLIPQIIRESAGRFAYFHANDTNLKGPGFGKVDFRPIAKALREVGYDGVVSVEVFNFDEGPEVIASRSLACLREAFSCADV